MNKVKEQAFLKSSLTGGAVIALLVLWDQLTKLLAVRGLKGQPSISLLPGVLELKYLENRGIAFGLFQGRVAFFVILCVIFFIAALYFFIRIPKTKYFTPLLAILFLMVSGGIGNFIDRVFRGFVVDFIYFSLIDFPIFNVADIYVVCGGILLVLFVCFKYKDEDFDFIKFKKKG